MKQQYEQIVNDFGIWLKILNHDVIADALEVARTRIDRYARMSKEELATKIKLQEVADLEILVNEKYGFEFTDAPNVRIEKKLTVE